MTDPHVYSLAELFVDETLKEIGGEFNPMYRKRYIDQAADAMQRTIEGECEAIRQELNCFGSTRSEP